MMVVCGVVGVRSMRCPTRDLGRETALLERSVDSNEHYH